MLLIQQTEAGSSQLCQAVYSMWDESRAWQILRVGMFKAEYVQAVFWMDINY